MTQAQQLTRVATKIASAVISFCALRLRTEPTFHASDLHKYVGDSVAPASADRVLRALNSGGALQYTLISRAGSLYRIDAVDEAAEFNAALEFVPGEDAALAAQADDDGYVPTTNAVPEGATLEEWEAPDPDLLPW